jgi:DNA gyrase subunit A
MEVGLVRSVNIDNEMQQAYLDYAMSVIVARAIPDARDGFKPVHRRILYAMYDMGLRPDTAHKKSARIVGEVLGKYHPHGDMAVYEAMARMAQDFSMRYLLVDGQGNFGSVDGDPPAAMRYTEARLTAAAIDMLADIQRNTVDFIDNFDGSLSEPDVLPSALPNMLVNGATGIAVGMSTSIPPHNLGEVVDALIYMLGHWEAMDDINVDALMQFIKGPDFPTGGIIVQGQGEEGLTSAYGSGRGKVTVQARAHFEEMSRGRNRIIVTELPYMTNKSTLIERIAELVRDERLEGVADLRDESDRHGLRIVIELTKTAEPEKVLQNLYKLTPMRSTFGIIMLALVDGEPRLLSLKQALRVYLDHRQVVIRRRSEFDLERARQRAHILEGLRVALRNLDAIIDLIRKSPDVETARTRLMKRFRLSEIQSQAILDMPLRRLAALERKKIEDEYKEVTALIKELEGLLRSPRRMRQVVADELLAVKEAYGDRRRTQITQAGKNGTAPLMVTEMAPDLTVWVSVTAAGLVSRSHEDAPPASSGRDAPWWLLRVNTRDTLYLVSELGESAGLPVHSLPEEEDPNLGVPIYKISALGENEKLAAIFTLPPKEERPAGWFVLTATRQGLVKKTALSELPGPTAKTFTLMKVNEGDRFSRVLLTDGKAYILLATAYGMAIRFSEEDVRPMGLVAAGVNGIKLLEGDSLIGMELAPTGGELLMVTTDGKAKRVPVDQFPVQGRYGQGVVAWKLPRTAALVGLALVPAGRARMTAQRLTLHLDRLAPKMLRFEETPLQTRVAQGKTMVELKAGARVLYLMVPDDLSRSLEKTGGAQEPSKPERKSKIVSSEIPQAAGQSQKPTREPKAKEVKPAGRSKTAPAKTAARVKPVKTATAPRKPGAVAKPGAAIKTTASAKGKVGIKTSTAVKAARVEKKTSPVKTTPSAKTTSTKKTAAPVKPAAAGTLRPTARKSTSQARPVTGREKPSSSKRAQVKSQLTFEDLAVSPPKPAPVKKGSSVKSTVVEKKSGSTGKPIIQKKPRAQAPKVSRVKKAPPAKPAPPKSSGTAKKPAPGVKPPQGKKPAAKK